MAIYAVKSFDVAASAKNVVNVTRIVGAGLCKNNWAGKSGTCTMWATRPESTCPNSRDYWDTRTDTTEKVGCQSDTKMPAFSSDGTGLATGGTTNGDSSGMPCACNKKDTCQCVKDPPSVNFFEFGKSTIVSFKPQSTLIKGEGDNPFLDKVRHTS